MLLQPLGDKNAIIVKPVAAGRLARRQSLTAWLQQQTMERCLNMLGSARLPHGAA
jgi:hypothetical protein